MHEFSLFASVPSARFNQILNVLTGIAAMPPQMILERHLLYRPQRQPSRNTTQYGASQDIQDPSKMAKMAQLNGDMYYMRLVEDWNGSYNSQSEAQSVGFTVQNGHYRAHEHRNDNLDKRSDSGEAGSDSDPSIRSRDETNSSASRETPAAWQLRFYDVPAPGKRPVTSRGISIVNIENRDGALQFMEGLGYRFIHQYLIDGHQFINNNIVLLLHRILRLPDALVAKPDIPPDSRPAASTLTPLDESGGWTLEASVRVLDPGNPDHVAKATAELTNLRDLLRGSLDLRPVERLALDTRVR